MPRERVEAVHEHLQQADAVLVVGSSLMVYSGFRFVQAAAKAGLPVAALNRGRTRADDLLQFRMNAIVLRRWRRLSNHRLGRVDCQSTLQATRRRETAIHPDG